MFASKSSHKRKRSAVRRDAEQNNVKVGRSIISLCRLRDKIDSSKDSGKEKLKQVINSHIFNHQTNVILPFTQDIDQISRVLPSDESINSYSASINLTLFLDPLFVLSYIKRGTLSVLSIGNLDSDDVICMNEGQLILSLCKETYYELGIEGQALNSSRGASGRAADRRSGEPERFVVIIDLLSSSFEPGRNGYERISSRLRAWDSKRCDKEQVGSWNVVMNWCKDEDSFGDEIEFPQQNVIRDSVKRVPINLSRQIVTDSWLPTKRNTNCLGKGWSEKIGQDDMLWPEWYEALVEQLEWASMSVLNCDCIRTFWRSDELHSNPIQQSYEPGKLIKITYTGFLPFSLGNFIIDQIQPLIQSAMPNPFAIIQNVGFADAPISWSLRNFTLSKMKQNNMHNHGVSLSPDSDSDLIDQTGPKARRKRNKKKKKRGVVNPNQHGHQSRNENSIAIASGWQIILFSTKSEYNELANCIIVENIGDAQRS